MTFCRDCHLLLMVRDTFVSVFCSLKTWFSGVGRTPERDVQVTKLTCEEGKCYPLVRCPCGWASVSPPEDGKGLFLLSRCLSAFFIVFHLFQMLINLLPQGKGTADRTAASQHALVPAQNLRKCCFLVGTLEHNVLLQDRADSGLSRKSQSRVSSIPG